MQIYGTSMWNLQMITPITRGWWWHTIQFNQHLSSPFVDNRKTFSEELFEIRFAQAGRYQSSSSVRRIKKKHLQNRIADTALWSSVMVVASWCFRERERPTLHANFESVAPTTPENALTASQEAVNFKNVSNRWMYQIGRLHYIGWNQNS